VGSTAVGLTSQEAERRFREYGPNRVEQVRRRPLPLRLLQEFAQFFSIILWIAAALAFLAEWSSPGEGMARIGYAIVSVILVSDIFSFWQEYKNERALSVLLNLLPQQVKVLRDRAISQLTVEQLVIGDIILLAAGDNVPADCRLIEAFDARVNDATITESCCPRCATQILARRPRRCAAGTSCSPGHRSYPGRARPSSSLPEATPNLAGSRV
jgi:sodium/potassium-transporting ATPase subunit alpha